MRNSCGSELALGDEGFEARRISGGTQISRNNRKSCSWRALIWRAVGLILRIAEIPLVPLRCLLFIKEITIDSMSKLNVDSREYTCRTVVTSFSNVADAAKK